jgi:hypothetical protein
MYGSYIFIDAKAMIWRDWRLDLPLVRTILKTPEPFPDNEKPERPSPGMLIVRILSAPMNDLSSIP